MLMDNDRKIFLSLFAVQCICLITSCVHFTNEEILEYCIQQNSIDKCMFSKTKLEGRGDSVRSKRIEEKLCELGKEDFCHDDNGNTNKKEMTKEIGKGIEFTGKENLSEVLG